MADERRRTRLSFVFAPISGDIQSHIFSSLSVLWIFSVFQKRLTASFFIFALFVFLSKSRFFPWCIKWKRKFEFPNMFLRTRCGAEKAVYWLFKCQISRRRWCCCLRWREHFARSIRTETTRLSFSRSRFIWVKPSCSPCSLYFCLLLNRRHFIAACWRHTKSLDSRFFSVRL